MPGSLQAKLCPILYGSVSVVGGENLHKITSILIYMLLLVCNVFLQLIQLLNFNFHQVVNKEVFFYILIDILESWTHFYFLVIIVLLNFRDRIIKCLFVWFLAFLATKNETFFCNLVFDEHTAMKSYTKMYMYTNSGQFFFLW